MPYESVADYIASLPQPARRVASRVRTVIRKSIPACDESIAYDMPAYKLAGKSVLFFAAWKKHWALYPAYPSVVAAFAKELEPYEITKGTIRFPYDARLPVHLIGRIAKLRLAETRSATKTKSRKTQRG